MYIAIFSGRGFVFPLLLNRCLAPRYKNEYNHCLLDTVPNTGFCEKKNPFLLVDLDRIASLHIIFVIFFYRVVKKTSISLLNSIVVRWRPSTILSLKLVIKEKTRA